MRVPSLRIAHVRRGKADVPPGLVGVARVDLRTKVLVKRLAPGDIAIIDHADLDRVSADELISCRPAAVVNAARSITGRYPNLGPRLLFEAGIPLVDDVGREVLARVTEGETVRLDGDVLYKGDQAIAKGVLQTEETLSQAMDEATAGVESQIDAFAANTLEFLRRERDLLTKGIDNLPPLATDMDGRHVLVVVRGYRYREDLRALRPYIREYRPVLRRRGRRGGRAARGGLPPARDHRRHGLGLRRGAASAGPSSWCTPTPTAARPDCPGSRTSASTRSRCPPPAPARTWRCWSPTPAAPA